MKRIFDKETRLNMAKHPGTPDTILEQFLYDEDKEVSMAAVRNPRISPKSLQEYLSNAPQKNTYSVKAAILNNPNLPKELRDKFHNN